MSKPPPERRLSIADLNALLEAQRRERYDMVRLIAVTALTAITVVLICWAVFTGHVAISEACEMLGRWVSRL